MEILKWYKKVKDPVIRKQLLANYDINYLPKKTINDFNNIYDAITWGFNWGYSPEKHEYWYNIRNQKNLELEENMTYEIY